MSFLKRLFISLLALTSFSAFAAKPEKLTAPCKGQLDGAPKPSIESLSKVTAQLETSPLLIDFETRLQGFCMTFVQTSANALPGAIYDLKTDAIREKYFTELGCEPQNLAPNTYSPVVQLIGDVPCDRGILGERIQWNYPKLWTKAINVKNKRGQTYLDYMYMLSRNDHYLGPDEIVCAKKLIEFACRTGGEFSKYKDETKCPETKM